MNSDKLLPSRRHHETGNAMIYILLALALLAALTMAITKQGDQAGSSSLDPEKAELLATKTVAYAGSVKNAVDQMMMSGTNISALSYVRPNQSSFDTAPHYNKIFHPEGGGITLDAPDPDIFTSVDTAPLPGWYLGRFNNIEWTPTTANDIVLAAYGISETLCATLNKKITGSTTIPTVSVTGETLFVAQADGGGGANVNFTKTICPTCDGYPTLCVKDATPDYTYYNIISGQ